MKKINLFLFVTVVTSLVSCGSHKAFLDVFVPQESSLNLVKVTDESTNPVLSSNLVRPYFTNYGKTSYGVDLKNKVVWPTPTCLAISPDGKKLAYKVLTDKKNGIGNVMICNANGSANLSTQRTFRNVGSISWGSDNKLYFADINGSNSYICAVNGESGSTMSQLTNGNVVDGSPVLSADGKSLYFVRSDGSGPSIWMLNRQDGTLSMCTRGFNPCLVKDEPNALYVVRNTTNNRSEIWKINYVKGEETLVLADANHSFTNPSVSPDGKWIACVGNASSSVSRKQNLDIFVVRTNGTEMTQLTFHPEADTNPVWSKDGRSIYFISSRANKESYYNVWRMNFNLND